MRFLEHTQTYYTRWDSSGLVIVSTQRPYLIIRSTHKRHPYFRRDSNPQSQQASGCISTPSRLLSLGSAYEFYDSPKSSVQLNYCNLKGVCVWGGDQSGIECCSIWPVLSDVLRVRVLFTFRVTCCKHNALGFLCRNITKTLPSQEL
jgi:hypothetical protein